MSVRYRTSAFLGFESKESKIKIDPGQTEAELAVPFTWTAPIRGDELICRVKGDLGHEADVRLTGTTEGQVDLKIS